MNSLAHIAYQNEQAVIRDQIRQQTAAGLFVTQHYAGANYVGFGAYPTAEERNAAAAEWAAACPGNRSLPVNPNA